MRYTLATALSVSMLAVASLVVMPSDAQSQVIIIVGNGSAQPYYPPPYPYPPYPRTNVLYGAGFYPGYGYAASDYGSDYGYYDGYYGGYGYPSAYYGGGYYPHYGYGW